MAYCAPFNGQVCLFDVTIPGDTFDEHRSLSQKLNTIFKKWVFQKEQGEETGYIHWQVRGSLHKKTTHMCLMRDIMPELPGHWSVTSSAVHSNGNSFNYVMKVQTRIDGPWNDTEEVREPAVMTTQLEHYLSLEKYDWQVDCEAIARSYDERHIYYIYDPHYNSGKSTFCEYLEYLGIAEEIPPFTLMEDIMQFVMCQPVSKCYLFDMPAAMKKEKMQQMYSGLEMLKNGFLYDKRYNGKKRRISRPTVICFANNLPHYGLMAPDRYKTMYITPDKKLVKYNDMIHPIQEIHEIQDP